MAIVKAFAALRPAAGYAGKIAALPYDVMSSEEAREMVRGKPYSFLHVDKAEVDLDPSVDLYSAQVYAKARENLIELEASGALRQDEAPCLYIYRQIMDGRSQTGLVACASIDDYLNRVIKEHEHTRADKEADRIRHVDACDANTGPIFLTYRSDSYVKEILAAWMAAHKPVYDFSAEDGVSHIVWVIDDKDVSDKLSRAFEEIPSLYIADGHHRAASAVKVGQMRRAENPNWTGSEEFNYFLSVIFPGDELTVMDYNRVVRDLNGLSPETFLSRVGESFLVEPHDAPGQYKPSEKHTFGMYLGGKWYKLTADKSIVDDSDPVARLDVSIMQNSLLGPILGISDPRTDKRIDFVGGIRGLAELEKRAGADGAAFSMFPTPMEDLFDIADAGEVMPPKSTWFEPKLRSGLFIHKLK